MKVGLGLLRIGLLQNHEVLFQLTGKGFTGLGIGPSQIGLVQSGTKLLDGINESIRFQWFEGCIILQFEMNDWSGDEADDVR